MTATQLIYGALRLCVDGLKRAGRTGSSEQYADGLLRLNDMIDAWALENLTIYYLLRTPKVLGSGTTYYTIGTGGDINIVRPVSITYAGLIIDTSADPVTEVPIAVYTDQDWAATQQKDLTSPYIQGVYYDFNWSSGLARLYPWPIPTIGTTQLVLYSPQALTAFADLTTNYTFPPGYAEAIRYQLAIRLAPEFGGLLDPGEVEKLATKSLGIVKRGNNRPTQAQLDRRTPGLGAGTIYDWRTDQFR